ncbi:MAG: recombinase family protein [Chloroflexi bacterium]|nr:recombinase family protein [Chloroflexota bacterium]
MPTEIRAAIYVRVSTDLQEKEQTILSQLEAVRVYVSERGYINIGEYIDDGFSGATLDRPGLDRLRDAFLTGEIDVVVFHSPDRLARKAVYQGLVLEEIEKAGIRVEFLNYPVDDSPESRMLLGMQGLFAEYERAKIMERTRRGKLQRAREGALVGGHPPFGYRWIKRSESGRARLEISDYQAAVIRRMYRMLVDDQLSTRSIARKLTQEGVATAKGAAQWQPTAVFRMLTNPVYKGSYRYRQSGQEEILIPVPALVDDGTWQAAQSQLLANTRFSARNNRRHQYLLRGLVRCPRCSGTYTGFTQRGRSGYRCNRVHWGSSSTGQRCSPGAISGEPLENAVWTAVTEALQNPQILIDEYRSRLEGSDAGSGIAYELRQVELALRQERVQEDRFTQAYANEAMDLNRYKTEMDKLRARTKELNGTSRDLSQRVEKEQGTERALEHLESFCLRIGKGLDDMSFEERQDLLILVVDNISVENGTVRIDTIIPSGDGMGQLRTRRGELVEPSFQLRHRTSKPAI